MHFLRVLFLSFIIVVPHEAAAQQQDIFNLFGGLVRSGIAAAAQADWERLPNPEIACIDRALRERGSSINDLVRQGISPSDGRIAGVRGGCLDQASSAGPSFDCRRARFADEVAICGDPELARLDRLIGDGYQILLGRIGEAPARAIAAPLLASRRACGSEAGCIKNAQISTIRELQRRGAPITYTESASIAESPYVVDGLRLGGHVAIGNPSYLEYGCNPSEQFVGFTWCQRRRPENSPRGPYISTNTILHSADGTALYVNRFLEPAFFAGNEAMDDVRRLTTKFGQPRYVTPPFVAGAPRTLMASWGEVVLEPLDRARLADLAAGREVRAGVLIDHIGNYQRSAAMGLPVYRLTGGAGYVWAASWDQRGRGTLRFLTIDPSRLASTVPEHPDVASTTSSQPQNEPSLAPNESSKAASPASSPNGEPPASSRAEPPTAASQAPNPLRTAQGSETIAVPPAPAPPVDREPSAKNSVVERPAQPRVVGPPIAIQPVVKEATGGNTLQWVLMVAVAMLLAATGFLLFERGKRTGPPPGSERKVLSISSSAKAETAKEPALDLLDVTMERPEAVVEPILMEAPPPVPVGIPMSSTSSDSKPEGGNIDAGRTPIAPQTAV
jgi:uncharacterized protein